ncbi:MAG: PIN domain nuclease [Candidatus Riflebacteria bacterium HGW-Riflebacteria-1]|jgi:hypothetical protein|nr:MAG: PIN domain nuclease [Candidatus Riflebacteria bacterium HGW-Riflebacteria-1]
MLLDSNIFIYAVLPQNDKLRNWLSKQDIAASDITRLEVLGYHQLNESDLELFQRLFAMCRIYPVTLSTIESAIQLRRQKKMTLGDSIIAATALENKESLATRNAKDFAWINGLKVIDPFTHV